MTDTLAYKDTVVIADVKRFIVQTQDAPPLATINRVNPGSFCFVQTPFTSKAIVAVSAVFVDEKCVTFSRVNRT